MQKINKESEYQIIREKRKLRKTQKDWIEYFSNPKLVKQKIKMISAPDTYTAIKNKDNALESIKQDLTEDYLMTSSRNIFDKDGKSEVVHDAESKTVREKRIKVIIPNYNDYAKDDKETEEYLQALFDTKDSLKVIKETLETFSNKKLWLWTPYNRKDFIRAVGLCFGVSGFNVYGDVWVDVDSGFSRGVRLVPSSRGTGGKLR